MVKMLFLVLRPKPHAELKICMHLSLEILAEEILLR